MNIAHIVFSAHGNTLSMARYVHTRLGGEFFDVTLPPARTKLPQICDTLFVYVPVYSASFPKPLKHVFSTIKTRRLIIIATHGRMTKGRVWRDIASAIEHEQLLGLFSIPQKHTYKDETVRVDLSDLARFITLFTNKQLKPIVMPKEKAYRIARLSEPLRSAYNVKITIDPKRCTQCMQCVKACPAEAIQSDLTITRACIRCMRCVQTCEENAIHYTQSRLLRWYLKKIKTPHVSSVYVSR